MKKNSIFKMVETSTNNNEKENPKVQYVLETVEPSTRKQRSKDVWYYTGKARTVFNRQFSKNNSLKRDILESVVAFNCSDQEKFWLDYSVPVKRLLDSKRYNAECDSLKVDALILATHVVFLGKTTVNNVLDNGIKASLGEQVSLYKDVFLSEGIMRLMTSDEAIAS